MAKRSQHRESEGLEGRSERPATGMGSPEPKADREHTQVENLCYVRPKSVRDLDRHGHGVDVFGGRGAAATRGSHHHRTTSEELRRHFDR